MLQKPGRNYILSISLLPITTKALIKLVLKRLTPLIDDKKLIPNHQFSFRKQHATIEQVHHRVNIILEGKYFSATFLDISQAFDKV